MRRHVTTNELLPPSPAVAFYDRFFSGNPSDYEDLSGLVDDKFSFLNGFSVAFSTTWENMMVPGRVLELTGREGHTSVIIGNHQRNGENYFAFHVLSQDVWHQLDIKMEPTDRTHNYFCSISKDGMMWCYVDRALIGYNYTGSLLGPGMTGPNLTLGRSFWTSQSGFRGNLKELCIWEELVSVETSSNCGVAGQSSIRQPLLYLEGRAFVGKSNDFVDMEVSIDEIESYLEQGGFDFQKGVGIAFTARWDSVDGEPEVLHFGRPGAVQHIIISLFNSPNGKGFAFQVSHNGKNVSVEAPDSIAVGEEHRYLRLVGLG